MHGLKTINRLNYEAFAASIKRFQDQGRHVIARYAGVTLTAIETFTNHDEALAEFSKAQNATDSTGVKLFFPTPPEQVVGARDQSEDRRASSFPLADLADPSDPRN